MKSQKILLFVLSLLTITLLGAWWAYQSKENEAEQVINLRQDDFQTVEFCGSSYNYVGPVTLFGIDVVSRIAEIATEHPESLVCKNIENNNSHPSRLLTIEIRHIPLDASGIYDYLHIGPLMFSFNPGTEEIFLHSGFDGTPHFFGTFRKEVDMDYRRCPYGNQYKNTFSEFEYENAVLGFAMNIPADWFVPPTTDNDPHFYDCENGKGFEVQGAVLTTPEEYFAEMYEHYQQNLISKREKVFESLIPEAIVTEYINDKGEQGEGWPHTYLILFEEERRAFWFGSYSPIDEYPLISTFRLASDEVGILTLKGDVASYTNTRYKLQFSYPGSWRVGDTKIGAGTFQMFNYSEEEGGDNKSFNKGMNKIEMAIITEPLIFYADYNEVLETRVAGQQTYWVQEPASGYKTSILSYAIALPSEPGKFLAITMYGDLANRWVLEDLLKSLKWLYI